jgi:hypothetical protein
MAWCAHSTRRSTKGAFGVMKKKLGVATVPETLFVKGKDVDQDYEAHVLPIGLIHMHAWRREKMCVRLNQRE